MKIKKIVWLSVLLGLSLSKVHALTVELRNIADGSLSSQINFDAATSGALYQGGNQYLKISNPGTIRREVRIHADHAGWRSPSNPNAVSLDTCSLHSIGLSGPQPGMAEFNSDTESAWRKILDVNDSGSNRQGLILEPNEVRYVYFGVKTLFAAPGESYQTKLIVEVIDGASLATNIRPRQTVLSPNGDGINDAAEFGIAGSFEFKVFNIKGKTVRTLKDVNVWDGRDDGGEVVESGVYVYKVKAPGVKESGMLAVAK